MMCEAAMMWEAAMLWEAAMRATIRTMRATN